MKVGNRQNGLNVLNDPEKALPRCKKVGPKRLEPIETTLAHPVFGSFKQAKKMATAFRKLNGWPIPKGGWEQ